MIHLIIGIKHQVIAEIGQEEQEQRRQVIQVQILMVLGAFLNVHEGPQSISFGRGGEALEPGNIQSNEPGYYEPGRFGIRIENLIEVVEDEKLSRGDRRFLRFETLTLCPIDTRLVEPGLLSPEEVRWLDGYHARVRRELSPLLDPVARRWLKRACARVGSNA